MYKRQPYAYCSDPAPLAGQVVAAAGQVLRNWNAETLEQLFLATTRQKRR